MAYNLGVSGLLQFRKMLEAAKRGNVESVCDEMKNSKWFNQVGDRAEELIEQYRRG
jgi:lysozyme